MALKVLVIGAGGFIGSHLADALLNRGDKVTGFDNLSNCPNLHIPKGQGYDFVVGDILKDSMVSLMRGMDVVFHLAANPDARASLTNTRLDLEQNTIGTQRVLDAMRKAGVPKLFFASSGTVYGHSSKPKREEDMGSMPVSLYGASKLACEGLCSAYAECFGIESVICRFGNVIGPRATHGVIFDLCKKLAANPKQLDVLGDGSMTKPYVHVNDIVKGILWVLDLKGFGSTWNIAPRDTTSVKSIAQKIVAQVSPECRIVYGTNPAGWKGDISSQLDMGKLNMTGFFLKHTSDEAVQRAIEEIIPETIHLQLRKMIEDNYYGTF